jgi:hypothetical protein
MSTTKKARVENYLLPEVSKESIGVISKAMPSLNEGSMGIIFI